MPREKLGFERHFYGALVEFSFCHAKLAVIEEILLLLMSFYFFHILENLFKILEKFLKLLEPYKKNGLLLSQIVVLKQK